MPILLDHELREYIPHSSTDFPTTYLRDELFSLPDWTGPLHWHPDFEIASAERGVSDYQVGGQHVIPEASTFFKNIYSPSRRQPYIRVFVPPLSRASQNGGTAHTDQQPDPPAKNVNIYL